MEKVNYLPLGSIVLMDGGIQKILITSRGLVVAHNDEQVFFDYAGVPYPQGLISDDLLYFNHENIAKTLRKSPVHFRISLHLEEITFYVRSRGLQYFSKLHR